MRVDRHSRWLGLGIVLAVVGAALAMTIGDVRLASSQTVTLVAKRSEDPVPLDDPSDGVWKRSASVEVPLSGQNVVPPMAGGEGTVTARALHDGERLYIRVEWKDKTENASTSRQQDFSDAAAVQFPVTGGESVPSFCMGNPDAPVNIWQWKASWQVAVGGDFVDVGEAYPDMLVDLYPFEDETAFYPARAAGNVAARADRTTPTDNLLAGSFGTLTPAEDQIVAGVGEWDDGRWRVVFARDLTAGDEYAQFAEDQSANVAFAVWDGAKGERDGMKSVSQFLTLEVSSEIAKGGGGGLSGVAIGLFVVAGLALVVALALGYLAYVRRQEA